MNQAVPLDQERSSRGPGPVPVAGPDPEYLILQQTPIERHANLRRHFTPALP